MLSGFADTLKFGPVQTKMLGCRSALLPNFPTVYSWSAIFPQCCTTLNRSVVTCQVQKALLFVPRRFLYPFSCISSPTLGPNARFEVWLEQLKTCNFLPPAASDHSPLKWSLSCLYLNWLNGGGNDTIRSEGGREFIALGINWSSSETDWVMQQRLILCGSSLRCRPSFSIYSNQVQSPCLLSVFTLK